MPIVVSHKHDLHSRGLLLTIQPSLYCLVQWIVLPGPFRGMELNKPTWHPESVLWFHEYDRAEVENDSSNSHSAGWGTN